MKIEIAFNSEYLNFSISDEYSRRNYTAIIKEAFKARGKIYLTVNPPTNRDFIFLNIFQNDRRDEYSMFLDNYVFKYINIEKEEDYTDYTILNNDGGLDIQEGTDSESGEHTITCTFNKINVTKNEANVTYFFKVVDNETHFYEESYQTIAIMESPFVVVYKRNPEDSNGKITLKAKGDIANWVYLQVVAQIQQNTILEYVAYDGKYFLRPRTDGGDSESSSGGITTQTFLIVGGILLLLIIGLVVVVFIFQQRNKSLLNQVKHVSFQQSAQNTGSADPNLLLQKNQQ